MNIPVYRAKEIDSEEYVEGYVTYGINQASILTPINRFGEFTVWKIDPATLAINFEDMLDSQGNKIFASLNKDGRGGDIMKDDEYYGIAKYADSRFVVEYENVEECLCEGNFEVVGIQK